MKVSLELRIYNINVIKYWISEIKSSLSKIKSKNSSKFKI